MTLLFVILIVIAAVVLGFIVLVQNPKGGGLAGNIAGFSNQFMGVKQTTDVLEKGTWIFGAVIAVLCLTSAMFISKGNFAGKSAEKVDQKSTTTRPQPGQAPANNSTQFPGTPAPGGAQQQQPAAPAQQPK
jgi:preprotein translocase subunit SecG